MVIYFVQWERDKDLAKGTTKGRPSKEDYSYSISVMCRNVHDALSCQYLFMDGIHEPLCLTDLKKSLFKVANTQVF